ncbi:Predicted lipoprotein [Catalinimonas alkaloidigena]|uniref:Predicted lipoprotein n=1 Tax=Catalinimonas alkaloidigena TaxID=1075417 RepID=A0A1G9KME1_9BACT|nr:DUF2291 domain-containing protein [Catalinimonas alkaloidigena]SDL50694.1 Predicted lipoprotein [Catalinimonas alkaloidigena]
MQKGVKYAIIAAVALLLLYNSVYFRKLSEVQAEATTRQFDAKAYAERMWTETLPPRLQEAQELDTLVTLLRTQPEATFEKHSNALGIGNLRYFLVKGEGTLTAIHENDMTLALKGGTDVRLATEFIFGNAVRDASGLVDIQEFDNTMDINYISEELNAIIRQNVVPPFKQQAKVGEQVHFTGAIQLNKAHLDLKSIEIIPISLESQPSSVSEENS